MGWWKGGILEYPSLDQPFLKLFNIANFWLWIFLSHPLILRNISLWPTFVCPKSNSPAHSYISPTITIHPLLYFTHYYWKISLTDLCLSREQLPRPLFGLIEEARVLLLLQKPYQGKHPTYKYVHKWTHNKFQMTYICTYRFKLLNKCPPAATLSRQTSHIFYQLDFNFWTLRTEI